jgi:hypothetical protein
MENNGCVAQSLVHPRRILQAEDAVIHTQFRRLCFDLGGVSASDCRFESALDGQTGHVVANESGGAIQKET